jgi:hypothetical protein
MSHRKEPQADGSRVDAVVPESLVVRLPATGKISVDSTQGAIENQSLRWPLAGSPTRQPRRPLTRGVFWLGGIIVWLLGFWIMDRLLDPVLAGLLLWWVWAFVVACFTSAARLMYLDRYIRRVGVRSVTDDTPSDHYRAWHGRPHGGEDGESSHDTFVAYPLESHGRVAVQLLRYRPTLVSGQMKIKGVTEYRGKKDPTGIKVTSKGPGFAVTVVEQRSLPPDADTAEAAEFKAAMDERAASHEADARSRWRSRLQQHEENELVNEEARHQAAAARSTVEAIKHWRR